MDINGSKIECQKAKYRMKGLDYFAKAHTFKVGANDRSFTIGLEDVNEHFCGPWHKRPKMSFQPMIDIGFNLYKPLV